MEMGTSDLTFVPSPDVAAILHTLLDAYERRDSPLLEGEGMGARMGRRAVHYRLDSPTLPAYFNQADPAPRQITNDQLQQLEQAGALKLTWWPGETGHLLASVTLIPERAAAVFPLLNRTPQAARRVRLNDLLLGERFRFKDWRLGAVQHTLAQLKADKSPAPFSLTPSGDEFNRDLLTALAALEGVCEETPYRVFSVRVFNDSKRFEALMGAVTTLARRSQPGWRGLSNDEVLRELNLVPNPGHLYLHGPWRLVDEAGQVITLGEFHPSVGIPAAQAAKLKRVTVDTSPIICVENPTSFYELTRATQHATLCLWGNPSPPCRHLLGCLPEEASFQVWADIDYGGLNILAQLREQVNPRAAPYRMDVETLEAHARWARPLTPRDRKNLARLARRLSLADMRPLVTYMLRRGLKLEQEAVTPRDAPVLEKLRPTGSQLGE
jgi:Wadjet anti plasmid transformation system JetA-like protein